MNATPLDEAKLLHRYAQLDHVRLHYVELGPSGGPLVLLLHGFPEFWYGWRHQLEPLAAAGLRVVAPDLRGYNLSDKPSGIASYRLEVIADDIAQLVTALGRRAPPWSGTTGTAAQPGGSRCGTRTVSSACAS